MQEVQNFTNLIVQKPNDHFKVLCFFQSTASFPHFFKDMKILVPEVESYDSYLGFMCEVASVKSCVAWEKLF